MLPGHQHINISPYFPETNLTHDMPLKHPRYAIISHQLIYKFLHHLRMLKVLSGQLIGILDHLSGMFQKIREAQRKNTLPETNSFTPRWKRRFLLKTAIFRGYVSFIGSVNESNTFGVIWRLIHNQRFFQKHCPWIFSITIPPSHVPSQPQSHPVAICQIDHCEFMRDLWSICLVLSTVLGSLKNKHRSYVQKNSPFTNVHKNGNGSA